MVTLNRKLVRPHLSRQIIDLTNKLLITPKRHRPHLHLDHPTLLLLLVQSSLWKDLDVMMAATQQ